MTITNSKESNWRKWVYQYLYGSGVTEGGWDDLRFPSQGINPPGQAADPTLDTSGTGLYLFAGNQTNTLAGVAQMPHSWKEESTVVPHVHWQKTTGGVGDVLWQLDYEVVNNGDVAAMTYGNQLQVSTTVAGTPDNDTADELLISSFGDLSMTGKLISCVIFWKLSRIGGSGSDSYGTDCRLVEFDIHYQTDSFGSIQEFTKQEI